MPRRFFVFSRVSSLNRVLACVYVPHVFMSAPTASRPPVCVCVCVRLCGITRRRGVESGTLHPRASEQLMKVPARLKAAYRLQTFCSRMKERLLSEGFLRRWDLKVFTNEVFLDCIA